MNWPIRAVATLSTFAAAMSAMSAGTVGTAHAATADCRTGGSRLVELYDDGLVHGNSTHPSHLVVDAAPVPGGATAVCLYVQVIAVGQESAGGVVTIRGVQVAPGALPTVATDLSGCGPMQTLASGAIGDPSGPVHVPYSIAASADTSATVCIAVNGVAVRVSYTAGTTGEPPSATFEPDAAAARPSPPAYPTGDPERPSTECFGGPYGSVRFVTVTVAGVWAYYASASSPDGTRYASCFRVEGPGGVFFGGAQAGETSGRPVYPPSVGLTGDPAACTTNVASADAPVAYSIRYGREVTPVGLERHVLCVRVAGGEHVVTLTPSNVQDAVPPVGGQPPSVRFDTR